MRMGKREGRRGGEGTGWGVVVGRGKRRRGSSCCLIIP